MTNGVDFSEAGGVAVIRLDPADAAEGVRSFCERRAAAFKGR
jgi:hypothetical protein